LHDLTIMQFEKGIKKHIGDLNSCVKTIGFWLPATGTFQMLKS